MNIEARRRASKTGCSGGTHIAAEFNRAVAELHLVIVLPGV
jgi:hypothetical protein